MKLQVDRQPLPHERGQRPLQGRSRQRAGTAREQSQQESLEKVNPENVSGRRAEHLEHRDGFELLLEKCPDIGGDPDASHEQRDDSDQSQVHRELAQKAPEHRLRIFIVVDPHGIIGKPARELCLERDQADGFGKFEQIPMSNAASRLHQPGGDKSVLSNEDSRPQAEGSGRAIRLFPENPGDP